MSKQDELSPMMTQYLATKELYKDCILFYRLGDFYEMFYEDAKICSKELDLVLTGKDCGIEDRAPMCGIPYHSYEPYLQRLIQKGYKVAICEQTDNIVNGVMQREVVRIITPGTAIDSAIVDDETNAYMLCVYVNKNTLSYTYADISTGEVCVNEYAGDDLNTYLQDLIVKINPAEIICNNSAIEIFNNVSNSMADKIKFNEYYDWAFNYESAENNVLKQYRLSSLKGFDFNIKGCIISTGALFEYFKETQKRELKHIKFPKVVSDNQYMYIDNRTRRNLEIESPMHEKGKTGSLIWLLDQTLTSGGSRLLKSWVRQPLQNKEKIDARLNMISVLLDNPLTMQDLALHLDKIQDIERFVARISYGNITPKECIALSNSLSEIPYIKNLINALNEPNFFKLSDELIDLTPIANMIKETISDEPHNVLKEGGYIKEGFNNQLDELRNMRSNAENIILSIQAREREATGIKSIKIGYNKVFGYFLEVSKKDVDLVPFNYIRKQTTTTTERYITEELKKFEEQVVSSHDGAIKLEEVIFMEFKSKLMNYLTEMQQVAMALSTIDVVYSLAKVSIDNNYVRPIIRTDHTINIENGRHPIVEKMNKADFIPNDCTLDDLDFRTMILTGPNMAGKSTYMRQVALITLMAHIGSFVPASKAEICVTDRIFTRIGASDDLAVGQSTFMVEMIEVANILRFCTNDSLIILDEVGRGTSTFDGLSIAWSIVEYLSKNLKAKTMFATHYHELMQLEGLLDGVKNFCISIKEIGGKLVFLRKIMRGSATRSYGIEVADLAGIPDSIIARAKEILSELEKGKVETNKSSEVENIIREIDLNKMSPMDAFETLAHLKDISK